MDMLSRSVNTSLDEWLDLVLNPLDEVEVIECMFPTDRHAKEYLETIEKRLEDEVYELLYHFMIPTGSFGHDDSNLKWYLSLEKEEPSRFETLLKKPYFRRLSRWSISNKLGTPWEGTTWILELLPNHPRKALEVIDSFLLAHFALLPDWRISGLADAAAIIRAKYIGVPGTKNELTQFLTELDDRGFEHLVERLYYKMGYNTILTQAKGDGGRDVIAVRDKLGYKERIAVECKLYNQPVGVEYVRRLQGVVSFERFNRGVLFTSNKFTKGADNLAKKDHLIELISGDKLVILLNEFLGSQWPLQIERIILESRNAQAKKQLD